MADRFFDTSAAVKHYRVEAGTPTVDTLLGEPGARNFLSALGVVELHSVLVRLVRTSQLTAVEFHQACGLFQTDIARGLWQVAPVPTVLFQRAQQLLIQHGLTRSLRTLDALQLAAALALHAVTPLDGFVCADANLCYVAAAEGMTVVNPEVP